MVQYSTVWYSTGPLKQAPFCKAFARRHDKHDVKWYAWNTVQFTIDICLFMPAAMCIFASHLMYFCFIFHH